MTEGQPLTPLFLASAPPAVRAALARVDVEGTLREVWTAATSAWPDVVVPFAAFSVFVGERIPAEALEEDAARAIRDMRSTDLYLACGCARGDPCAIACFEQRLAPVVAGVVAGRGGRPELADEIRQALLERLFVPKSGEPAKIADYRGRGDLGGWLRVAAARLFLNHIRAEKRALAARELENRVPVPADDPELSMLEIHHREDFRIALQEAAAELTTRERNLLRQHHVDGLTMDQLAAVYGLHRVTIIRAIGSARKKLAKGTRRRLRERLRIDQAELDSLFRAVASKLDLSIRRYLAPG